MNMKIRSILLTAAIILLAMAGTVSATEPASTDAGVVTNVWFCKMTKSGNSYELEPLPTLYTGKNDYGRLTFITGANDLHTGDYALVQTTADGTELVESLTITKGGTETPEYTMLTLEFREDALPAPFEILGDPATYLAGTTPTVEPEITATALKTTPTTAKSPVSLLVIVIGLGIACILCVLRIRR